MRPGAVTRASSRRITVAACTVHTMSVASKNQVYNNLRVNLTDADARTSQSLPRALPESGRRDSSPNPYDDAWQHAWATLTRLVLRAAGWPELIGPR
jgi:hypothetical protein